MNVLVIGAHPDDFEIGMAGTIMNHANKGDIVIGIIMSNGEKIGNTRERVKEVKTSAKILGIKKLFFLEIKNTKIASGIKSIEPVESVVKKYKIKRVYTHSPHDNHQDHRETSLATLSACREVPQILFYESPSSDIDFRPTFFVDITPYVKLYVKSLQSYLSLKKFKKRYLEISAIESLAKFRGYQSKLKYADSFGVYRFTE